MRKGLPNSVPHSGTGGGGEARPVKNLVGDRKDRPGRESGTHISDTGIAPALRGSARVCFEGLDGLLLGGIALDVAGGNKRLVRMDEV